MPHSGLDHEKNSTSRITPSASMKYLLEKKVLGGGLFFEERLNMIMNSLGWTFVCLQGLFHWIPNTGEELHLSPETK